MPLKSLAEQEQPAEQQASPPAHQAQQPTTVPPGAGEWTWTPAEGWVRIDQPKEA